jgi:undecaprenyl-diphosphatase
MKRNSKLILSLISLGIFLLILILVSIKTPSIDYWISENIQTIWGLLDSLFIFIGNYSKVILIGIALVFSGILYLQKRKKSSFILIASLLIGYVIEAIINIIVQRERPEMQLIIKTDYSFPSGHAIFSIILFSLLVYFYKDEINNKTMKFVFIFINVLLILSIGFSRIYLNVHWITDVIGGYALGFFIINLILFFVNFTSKNNHNSYRR